MCPRELCVKIWCSFGAALHLEKAQKHTKKNKQHPKRTSYQFVCSQKMFVWMTLQVPSRHRRTCTVQRAPPIIQCEVIRRSFLPNHYHQKHHAKKKEPSKNNVTTTYRWHNSKPMERGDENMKQHETLGLLHGKKTAFSIPKPENPLLLPSSKARSTASVAIFTAHWARAVVAPRNKQNVY